MVVDVFGLQNKFMNKKVSVIIPSYNSARYIQEAIDSVLRQTYSSVEVIVIDDGSFDTTHILLKEYINDKKIVYILKENGGPASARNVGIRQATGEFITFLDADDIWEADKLDKQMPLFDDQEVGLVYSDMILFGGRVKNAVHSEGTKGFFRGSVLKQLIENNFISTSSVIVRRSIFDSIGYFNEQRNLIAIEDYDMWLRIAPFYIMEYISEPLVRYRLHDGQISSTKYLSVVRNLIHLHVRLLFKKEYRKYAIISCKKVLYLLRVFILKNLFLLWSKKSIKK